MSAHVTCVANQLQSMLVRARVREVMQACFWRILLCELVRAAGGLMQCSLISSAPLLKFHCLVQLPDPLSPDFMPFSVTASASVVAPPKGAPSAAGGSGRRLAAAAEALPEPVDGAFCSECAAACRAPA